MIDLKLYCNPEALIGAAAGQPPELVHAWTEPLQDDWLQISGSQWQPIETAPKDGEVFLGVDANIPVYSVVVWYDGKIECADDGEPRIALTHWMLLPAPPSNA